MKIVLIVCFLVFTSAMVRSQVGIFSTNRLAIDTLSGSEYPLGKSTANKSRYVNSTSRYLGLAYEGGYILPVDDKEQVNQMFKASLYRTITVTSSWDVSSTSVYSKIYRKPKLGLGISFVNFHNEVIGKPITIFGFTEIPVTRPDSKWYVSYGVGAGLGMGFRHYNKVENPGNIAIGSSVNAYLEANFHAGYWLSQEFLLTAATGYRHYSNGSTKQPNAGINIIPVQLSLKYQTRKFRYDSPTTPLPRYQKNIAYTVYNSVGMKQLQVDGPMVFKNLTGFNVGYQFSYKYRAALGFDINYTSGGGERVSGDASSFSKHFSYGPYAGWEWFFTDRIYVPVYFGVYLHRNYENDETNQFFQRLGIRYLFLRSKQLSAGVGLKTHFGQADFVEFNLGYTFRSKR
ncbi:MAG TPA: acyloxyacyl hydrolase [Chitinophagaceae bacterium]|nr:acyloxyacyl hydrolase [Chitinophagaceae bacterium]